MPTAGTHRDRAILRTINTDCRRRDDYRPSNSLKTPRTTSETTDENTLSPSACWNVRPSRLKTECQVNNSGCRGKALSTRAKSCVWTAYPYYQENPGRDSVQLHLISHAQLRGLRRTTRTSRDRLKPAAAGCRHAWAPAARCKLLH